VHYYKYTIEVVLILKHDLQEEHKKYRLARDAFLKQIADCQEETLLCCVAYKYMLKWSEKGARVVDQIKYIREIQKVIGGEDNDIKVLTDDNITRMHLVAEYWVCLATKLKARME
jgi:hypothetical protein